MPESTPPASNTPIKNLRDWTEDIGVLPELSAHRIDPFYTTKPTGEGMGLGLSISARIAAVFGGRITAANCSGGGAEFTLHLPLRESEP